MGRLAAWTTALALGAVAACGSDGSTDTRAPETPADPRPMVLVDLEASFPDLDVGDVIAVSATTDGSDAGGSIEWIERRTGRILRLPVAEFADDPAPATAIETVATIEVGTDGEQRGLLGHTVIDGVRYVAYTEPTAQHLVVAALDTTGAVDRIVWDAGGTAGGAVGGHLEAFEGRLVLGLGQLTDWAKANGSGAIVSLDPAGPDDQEPVVLSDGYTNPFAFAATVDALWVADNAVGDDVERIGRGDLADRDDHEPTGVSPRAPSALVALDDGLAVCGFLDGELRRWTPEDGDSGVLGPCRTGAAVLPDGTIVSVTDTAIVRFPAAS